MLTPIALALTTVLAAQAEPEPSPAPAAVAEPAVDADALVAAEEAAEAAEIAAAEAAEAAAEAAEAEAAQQADVVPPAVIAAPPLTTPAPAAPTTTATLAGVTFSPRAMIRVRGEFAGDRQLTLTPAQTLLTHRVRVGVTATAGDHVVGVVEVQDVRTWGGELLLPPPIPQDRTVYGTPPAPDGLMLHQGYLGVLLPDVELRLGRQEITVANERLIGPLDFAQRARAFDALRVLSRGDDAARWTSFFAVIGDHDVAGIDDILLGAWAGEFAFAKELRVSPTVIGDADITSDRYRATGGVRADGAIGGFAYDAELYGQITDTVNDVKSAGLLGLRASYGFETFLNPRFGGVVDVVSGASADGGSFATFDTLFATNHKFYGFQDLFLNLPASTKNQGLVDVAIASWIKEGTLSVSGYVHAFMPAAYEGTGTAMYGIEPDLLVSWKPVTGLALEASTAVFIPIGDALGRGDVVTPWGYLQVVGSI